jgi:predicted nucleic acid-binding protein
LSALSNPKLYVETDFILALIKDDDWLKNRAEAVYEEHGDDLWTARETLVELMMVAYREGWNVERVVADTNPLLEVSGDTDTVLAAASYVEQHDLTPFDALHLVNSGDTPIVSSDDTYDEFSARVRLEPDG